MFSIFNLKKNKVEIVDVYFELCKSNTNVVDIPKIPIIWIFTVLIRI